MTTRHASTQPDVANLRRGSGHRGASRVDPTRRGALPRLAAINDAL